MAEYVLAETVKVGRGVVIEPFAVVLGNSVLGDNCTVGSFSYLCNAQVGAGTQVRSSRITDSSVGENCTVGPNAHLRDGAAVGNNCRIGNFVEVKGSTLHNGVKAAHLSYIGDAEVGAGTNIGCGTVFVNFDGRTKHRTVVGEGCFVGCHVCLVAPLRLGDGCFVACGTTVDKDLPAGAFGIGRSRLTIKEGRAHRYLPARPNR